MLSNDSKVALQCLITLMTSRPLVPKTVAELSAASGMNIKLVKRLLNTMAKHGILEICPHKAPNFFIPDEHANKITLFDISSLFDGNTEDVLVLCPANNIEENQARHSYHGKSVMSGYNLSKNIKQTLKTIYLSEVVSWLASNQSIFPYNQHIVIHPLSSTQELF